MICAVCRKHATFEHVLFRGASPVKVGLCPECGTKVGAENHLATIKAAHDSHDKPAHQAAVEAFLKAVGK